MVDGLFFCATLTDIFTALHYCTQTVSGRYLVHGALSFETLSG